MKNLSTKKYVYMMILSISISVLVLVGSSYALIQRVLIGTNTYSMTTGNFVVEFENNNEITLSNQMPIYDNVGMSSGDEFIFSVTNTGNYISNYALKIEEVSTDILGEVIRYAVNYGDGYSYENVHSLVNNQYIIQNKSLEVGGTDNYRLRFWLDIDASENYVEKTFSAKVVIEATQDEYKYGTNVLQAIYNQEDKEGLVAINNSGTLASEIDEIREYRYSGANPKNYVWFNCENGYTSGSEHCEKWRIIGSFYNTYENGVGTYRMLKIVRDEALSTTQKYNSNTGNAANYEGSSLEEYLNGTTSSKYYYTLSSDTKNLIMKAKWNIGEALNTNNAINNYTNEVNKIVYDNVGLINASDFGYASDNTLWETALNTEDTFTSTNNYLYQENSMILNTPSLTGTKMYYILSTGLTEGNTSTAYNVRPTVYLRPDVSIINGYGTSEEPYELSIKYPMNYGIKTKIKAHEVTYNLNGGIGDIESTYVGENITSSIPTKEGYIFKGWSSLANATEPEYQSGDTYNGGVITLYAVWEEPELLRETIVAMAGDKVADDSDENTFFTQTAEEANTSDPDTYPYGVYKLKSTVDDTYPVYFFRGDHTVNNNVIFNGFCWKAVRTTELGGTRLIYNGLPTNTNGLLSCPTTEGNATMISMYENQEILNDNYQYSYTEKEGYILKSGISFKFNVNSDDAKYVGYKYQTTAANDTNSNLKNILDAWYEGAITKSNKEKVEDSIYCNDQSSRTSASGIYYSGYDRAKAGTPSVECPNASDSFTVSSGLSTKPVGFLTIDDVMLAGRTWNTGMQDYLYNYSYYWLGSPRYFNGSSANVYVVNNDVSLNNGNFVHSARGVRPVVSVNANTRYISGDGSMAKPFFVS